MPCLKFLGTQEKVSLICGGSQQQKSATTALAPLSLMSCEVLHHLCITLVQWLNRPQKKTSLLLPPVQLLLLSELPRTLCVVGVAPPHCSSTSLPFKHELLYYLPLLTSPSTHTKGLMSDSIIGAQQVVLSSSETGQNHINLTQLAQYKKTAEILSPI